MNFSLRRYLSDQSIGFVYIFLTALLWSFLGLLSKICLQNGLDPFFVAFLRATFGCIAFFCHCLLTGTIVIPVKDICILMIFGVWGIGIYYSFAQITILLAGASMDIILQYTAPFWVMLFSRIFFAEKIRYAQYIPLLLAAIGTVCVCLSGGSLPEKAPALGIITGLITGLCYATHYPFTRIWQKKYHPSTIFLYMLAGGALALFVLCSARGIAIPSHLPAYVWLIALCMGVLCTYVAFICFALSLQRISLLQAVITSELEPIFSIFWVWIFFNESFSWVGWLGGFLIILSVFLINIYKNRV